MRALGGRFVMRIEDLDPGRCRPHFEALLLEDLRWLGLDWDEGPDVGGAFGPYRQSEREAAYAAALARLDTYPCTCSRRELRESTAAPHGAEPVYPGTCRVRPIHRGRPSALRWRVPPVDVHVHDDVVGELHQHMTRDVGDVILRRNDGAWAYQLAVVVDDAAMRITHVLRGADLIESTPRQVCLQRVLGLPTPRHAHVPLVLGPDGEKLSKRHGAPDLGELRAAGVAPERVVAVLARSIGMVPAETRSIAAGELVPRFDLGRLERVPVPLELAALR